MKSCFLKFLHQAQVPEQREKNYSQGLVEKYEPNKFDLPKSEIC
jgi:hypothetical protein